MRDDKTNKPSPGPSREDRLKQALRENLKRRKSQERARRADEGDESRGDTEKS